VLQPEQYRAEHGRIRFHTRMRETAQISGISYQDRAYQKYSDLTTNQEVAGSSPAERAPEMPAKGGKNKAPGNRAGGFGSTRAAIAYEGASSSAVAATLPLPGNTWE
jgi:hypothetical protein